MESNLSIREINFVKFCDNIEITTDNEVYIFNVVWVKEKGFYLQDEDELLISRLSLLDSKLSIYYANGEIKELNEKIMTINIDDYRFRRKYITGIEGTFLKFSEEMAIKYNLDKELAYPPLSQPYTRKKTK